MLVPICRAHPVYVHLVQAGPEYWPAARALLEVAVTDPAQRHQARFLLWEVCQAMHEREVAVRHLRDAVAEYPFSHRTGPSPRRSVLALMIPGDYQTNLPLEPLLDPATTDLHTWWMADLDAPPPEALPPFDCVFIAIAEDQRHARALFAADAMAARLGKPVINPGRRIAAMTRDGAAGLLAGLPNAVVPPHLPWNSAETPPADLPWPMLIRPRFSHAGQALVKLDGAADLVAWTAVHPNQDVFLTPFIDFRSPDGFWRKFRVIFVDGEPWPFHLAIHDHWAVWYYNTSMATDAWKRAEEERLLADITRVFPPAAMAALRELAARIGLDYFGLDCALMPDGRLVVFEVETGMIVHNQDDPSVYPYKRAYVPRIMRAVEAMLDRRIAGN